MGAHDNPYDAHTLSDVPAQAERIAKHPAHASVNMGCRAHGCSGDGDPCWQMTQGKEQLDSDGAGSFEEVP